jgi:mRNA-degrading endonuclease RelE of RelBE toxin-antitoxin system
VSRATEVYSREFDSVFLTLPRHIRELIEAKIQDAGSRLGGYSHHRLKGRSECRLRAADYRIIYEFDQQKNILYLLTLGHRREIYR